MRNLNPMTLVMVAWLATAGTAVRVAPAQSAPAESGKSNSTTATTNSKTTKGQSAQPQSASRWTAGGNTPGNGGASSWGPTLKSSETEADTGSAGAPGFGSTIQPGGIWRSTQAPPADENAASPARHAPERTWPRAPIKRLPLRWKQPAGRLLADRPRRALVGQVRSAQGTWRPADFWKRLPALHQPTDIRVCVLRWAIKCTVRNGRIVT